MLGRGGGEGRTVAQESDEDEGGYGEDWADEVEEVGEPAEVGDGVDSPDGEVEATLGAAETELGRRETADVEGDCLAGPGDALDAVGRGGVVDAEGQRVTFPHLLDGIEDDAGSRPLGELLGCLLVVKPRGEEEAVEPG